MTYYKFPLPKIRHEGIVLNYNHIKSVGIIRESSGTEYPFNGSSILCRRIEAGDRVQFVEKIDGPRLIAVSINKY
jgi:hypothetical protein